MVGGIVCNKQDIRRDANVVVEPNQLGIQRYLSIHDEYILANRIIYALLPRIIGPCVCTSNRAKPKRVPQAVAIHAELLSLNTLAGWWADSGLIYTPTHYRYDLVAYWKQTSKRTGIGGLWQVEKSEANMLDGRENTASSIRNVSKGTQGERKEE